jgi:hypothetical protein
MYVARLRNCCYGGYIHQGRVMTPSIINEMVMDYCMSSNIPPTITPARRNLWISKITRSSCPGFLQIPRHREHPCPWLCAWYYQPALGTFTH